jgi:AbrB family looped-hinge helix DNA binding protein
MTEYLSVVTRKGQITLPAEFRRSLGIREGDKVLLAVSDEGEGTITVRLARSVAESTFGAVTPQRRPEDWQELREQFVEGVADEALDEMSARRGA